MFSFKLESWNAIAPGLVSHDDWRLWLQAPAAIDEPLHKVDLSAVPAMLRRRFNTLGRCAMGSALPLVKDIDAMPGIFASRHGDSELSFSLLKGIGEGELMSPTSFSLAVHNAVSGLFSIARNDNSEVTAIAAMQGLVLQTLFEAAGQLQESASVLCVIYDTPLPAFYSRYCADSFDSFPWSIAMVLSRIEGRHAGENTYLFESLEDPVEEKSFLPDCFDIEPFRLLRVLTGLSHGMNLRQSETSWRLSRRFS